MARIGVVPVEEEHYLSDMNDGAKTYKFSRSWTNLYYIGETKVNLYVTLSDLAGNVTSTNVYSEPTINPLNDTGMLYYKRSDKIAKCVGRTYYKNANTDDPMLGGYYFLTNGSGDWEQGYGIANTKKAAATRCAYDQCARS